MLKLEPLGALLLFIGFGIWLGCAGASDIGRPFPWTAFWIGTFMLLIGFVFVKKVV